MTTHKFLTPVAFVATFALAAVPAFAEQHHGGGSHSAGSSRSSAPASRGGGSRGGGGTVSRGSAQSRSYPVYRGGSVVRGGVVVRNGGGYRVAPRYIGPRGIIVGHSSYYRPYYSFRPRLSLGFGIWAGYPVPYPYYDYPYGYVSPYPADPYAYGYAAPSYGYPAQPYGSASSSAYPPSSNPSDYPEPGSAGQGYPQQQPQSSVGVQQGGQQSAPGGVSFEITPDSAAVFVDGTYVGTAGSFGPTSQPLGLISGRHHIEIRASGYRTMTIDADVTAGQVIPYQGTLERN